MTAENAGCEGDLGRNLYLFWEECARAGVEYCAGTGWPEYNHSAGQTWHVPMHDRGCSAGCPDESPYYWTGSPAARAVILTTVLGHLFQLVPGSISEVLSIARGGGRPPEEQILAYDKLMLVLAQAEEGFTVFWVYTLAGFTGWPPEDVLSTLRDMSASTQEQTMAVVERASAHGGWEHEA